MKPPIPATTPNTRTPPAAPPTATASTLRTLSDGTRLRPPRCRVAAIRALATRCLRASPLRAAVLAAGICFAALPGQARADAATAARYYEDAVHREAEGDANGAILQLKNALLEQPDLLPALLLLGRIQVASGQGAEAETALTEARRLGADAAIVMPLLAEAWLMQFEQEQVLAEVRPEGFAPPIAARLHVLRGQAQIDTRRLAEAEQSFRAAIAHRPDSVDAHLGLAKLHLQRGDLASAEASLTTARGIAPDSAEVWNHQASLAHTAGDLERALADYALALRLEPLHREARLARAAILLDLDRDAEAALDLATLAEAATQDPRVAYLDALRLARAGDAKGSREKLMRSVGVLDAIRAELIDRNVQLLMLGGLVNHGLGQFEKAKGYLERVMAIAPELAGARKLLGKILLAQGRGDQALTVLIEAERKAPGDAELLSLLASAYMERGLHDRAAALLQRAVEATQDPALRTQLGVARILAGETLLGMDELDAVLQARPDDARAGLLLALKQLEEGQGGAAIARISRLLEREPGNPVLLNLRGVGERLTGDLTAARRSFEAAAAADARFLPARINLARLSEVEGDRTGARHRLEALAREHPDDRELLLARVRLARSEDQLGEAARLLDRLRTLNPDDIPIRLAQIDLDLQAGDAPRALKSAEDLFARFPESLPVQESLGRSQVSAGRAGDARVTFRRMADRAGFDTGWQVRIAALQRSIGADDDARHSLQKAIQADPNLIAGRRDLAVLELDTGHPQRARDLALALRKDFPEDNLTQQLEADALLALNEAEAARAAYAAVYAREPTLPRLIGLSRAHAILGDLPAAVRLLGEWYAQHPEDDLAGLALAEFQSRAGQTAAATVTYEALLARRPDDPILLNNLAQLLTARDAPRAVALARRAVELAPTDADFLDTLGWLLVATDAADEGLRHLREARSRAADNPTHAYHLALALERLGRAAEARREVDEALASGRDFPEREAARALVERLSDAAPPPTPGTVTTSAPATAAP